ncbi:MAG: type I methionyl aminopeptidase [Phenylobacterium sp.]|nr:type I methionyl aminopeptidase [Phenylobacterium sp.]
MTIDTQDQFERLQAAGRLVARTLKAMGEALEPGITTGELDALGREMLEAEGARSAPQICVGFPAATCISVGPDVAHGIPGDRRIEAGDLVNIDVSAELDGFFADNGASFAVPPTPKRIERLCRDGRRAMWTGIRAVRAGGRLNEIGRSIETFGYTLVRNLASHGVGSWLHEEPEDLATWYEPRDERRIHEGMVFTIEPFLSLGAEWVDELDDGWTLRPPHGEPTVQYEHTLVATKNGPVILTLA